MSTDGQDTKCHRKIAEIYNRLTRVHERYRQTDERLTTDGRQHIANVKRFALCYRSFVCLSCLFCLSVTLVHCGQTVGRIQMKHGMPVGLYPGHIVLDGTPNYRPIYVVAKWLDGSRCHMVGRWASAQET